MKRKKRMATAAGILFGAAVFLLIFFHEFEAHTQKIGYWENSGTRSWTAQYFLFSGTEQHALHLGDTPRTIQVDVRTDSGSLGMEITGSDGTVFYKGDKIPTSSFSVKAQGDVTVKVRADRHKGAFSLQWDGP